MSDEDDNLTNRQDKVIRLMRLIELLRQDTWKAAELEKELEVSQRTIFEDLKDVELLARPKFLNFRFIHDKLRGEYRIEPIKQLGLMDSLVSHLAVRMLANHSPGYNTFYQEATRKLAKEFPPELRGIALQSAEALAQRALVSNPGNLLNGSNLERITEAWIARKVIEFYYQIPSKPKPTRIELEVFMIEVSRANMAVYLIGKDRLYSDEIFYQDNFKTYKLDRIVGAVKTLDQTYFISDDFDPTDYLSTAWGIVTGKKSVTVKLKFSPDAAYRILEGGYPNFEVGERLEDGSLPVEIKVGTDDEGFPLELLPWISSWGPRVEVIEPESLRARWLEEARAVVDLYDPRGCGDKPASQEYWAHTPRKDDPKQQWQPLREHLEEVAAMAQGFAGHFKLPEASNLAYWAGILHDLGKYSQEFQDYLKAAYRHDRFGAPKPKQKVDHSSAGAILGRDFLLAGFEDDLIPINGIGSELAWAIAYHHGGINDRLQLVERIVKHKESPAVEEAHARAFTELEDIFKKASPEFANLEPFSREFFIRMLLSTLVDADRLDTERFWNPKNFARRLIPRPSVKELLTKVKAKQEAIKNSDTVVNQARWEIYQSALKAAMLEPGFFRLTVPTGGGKTRTSLAFALEHGVKFGKRRVVYAIPFTSIIDQTADVFAELLCAENVLEHHSAYEASDTEDESRTKLASENWDMPVVVTTNVQLFESLFSNKTSKLRKIHNLAGSVVVLDEVQTLPANLLQPTLDALRELVKHYGVTVVLCTATQPALDAPLGFATLEDVREIVPQPERYFRQLKRVEYTVDLEPQSWETLAEKLRTHEQVLCIVNTKKQAQELFAELADPEAIHLSTYLYPAHRREILASIRARLKQNQPCRVVSTQLVEAGVDLDFPFVYRALGPLDSMVQAAGRCNREGKLEVGKVVIFRPEKEGLPQGTYASATRLSSNKLKKGTDFDDPQVFTTYFTELYRDLTETDARGIQALRSAFNYPQVAEGYRLIEDNTFPVLIRKRSQDVGAIDEILNQHTGFAALRKLQPYTVSVYASKKDKVMPFIREMEELEVELWEWTGQYDEKLGIVELFDAENSVV